MPLSDFALDCIHRNIRTDGSRSADDKRADRSSIIRPGRLRHFDGDDNKQQPNGHIGDQKPNHILAMGAIRERSMAFGRKHYPESFALALAGKLAERKQHQDLLLLVQCTQLVRWLPIWHGVPLPRRKWAEIQHILPWMRNRWIYSVTAPLLRPTVQHSDGPSYLYADIHRFSMATHRYSCRAPRSNGVSGIGLDKHPSCCQEIIG